MKENQVTGGHAFLRSFLSWSQEQVSLPASHLPLLAAISIKKATQSHTTFRRLTSAGKGGQETQSQVVTTKKEATLQQVFLSFISLHQPLFNFNLTTLLSR